MEIKKIYLVRAYSRESYDDSNFTLDAFVDKSIADKVAAGFDDATDTRINTWIIKQAERDEKLESISSLESNELAQAIYDEYEKYEVYWDTYYYQVYEIDLIN